MGTLTSVERTSRLGDAGNVSRQDGGGHVGGELVAPPACRAQGCSAMPSSAITRLTAGRDATRSTKAV